MEDEINVEQQQKRKSKPFFQHISNSFSSVVVVEGDGNCIRRYMAHICDVDGGKSNSKKGKILKHSYAKNRNIVFIHWKERVGDEGEMRKATLDRLTN